jgi:hypothetical protein
MMGFATTVEVQTSREFKVRHARVFSPLAVVCSLHPRVAAVCVIRGGLPRVQVTGAIGPCTSLKKTNKCVSETEVGEGGTYTWALGGIDPSTTLALYFEVANSAGGAPVPPGKRYHLQIVTRYAPRACVPRTRAGL